MAATQQLPPGAAASAQRGRPVRQNTTVMYPHPDGDVRRQQHCLVITIGVRSPRRSCSRAREAGVEEKAVESASVSARSELEKP
uniref:Uncharacterized protein n=1 Tax=Oryza barthii TaxID=65489 RepID=A0A0D3F282_9ORYZ